MNKKKTTNNKKSATKYKHNIEKKTKKKTKQTPDNTNKAIRRNDGEVYDEET